MVAKKRNNTKKCKVVTKQKIQGQLNQIAEKIMIKIYHSFHILLFLTAQKICRFQ